LVQNSGSGEPHFIEFEDPKFFNFVMNFPVFCDFLKILPMNQEHRPQPWAWIEVPHSPAPCFQIRKARCRASWCLEWQRQGLKQVTAHLEYMDTWTSMNLQGHPQTSTDIHGHPWKLIESHRNPLNSTKIHEIPPSSVEISGRCTLFLCYSGGRSEESGKVWSLPLLSECMLMAGLWQISTSQLREASLLVLGEELSLKCK